MKAKVLHSRTTLAISLTCALFSSAAIGADVGSSDFRNDGPMTRVEVNRNVSDFNVPVAPIYTGRSPYFRQSGPIAVAAPAPAPRPAPVAPAPTPPVVHTSGILVGITKQCPAEAALGETYCCEIVLTAHQMVGDIVVKDAIPEGTSLVSTEPQAQQDGRVLVWKMASMQAGETKTIKVCLKAEKEGEMANCATVSAVPMSCASTIVGQPVLAIKKTGPAEVRINEVASFNIVVSNTGSAPAKNVVVTDTVPDGLVSPDGQKTLTFNVGDLAPGASKTIPVALTATDKRGNFCNKAVATASNAKQADAQACVDVVKHFLSLTKTTPDKSLIIGRVATYTITIENPGDRAQTEVVLTDTAAPETKIVEASGAVINGNTATWNVGTVEPGTKKSFEVKVQSREPGKFCDVAKVTSKEGSHNEAQDCTEWLGVTGVLVELKDDPDPIQVGETSTYTVRVTNQGSTRSIEQMAIKVIFPAEIDPTSASSDGQINGKIITFPVVPSIAPRTSVTVTFVGKAIKTGDARIEAQVTTSTRQNPIVQFESTTVY